MKTRKTSKKIDRVSHRPPAVPEEWEVPIRVSLEAAFGRWDKRSPNLVRQSLKKRATNQAIKEIVAGVKFCQNQKTPVPIIRTTLSDTFNIGSECACLLAKGLKTDFCSALDKLRIDTNKAGRIGCAFGGDYFWDIDGWSSCYNYLWRATGKFFKAHPEFGVK